MIQDFYNAYTIGNESFQLMNVWENGIKKQGWILFGYICIKSVVLYKSGKQYAARQVNIPDLDYGWSYISEKQTKEEWGSRFIVRVIYNAFHDAKAPSDR